MDHDLSKCQLGDYVATLKGWSKVKVTKHDATYPICVGGRSFSLNGYDSFNDKIPSCFIEPPKFWFEIIGPKPCKFKKG